MRHGWLGWRAGPAVGLALVAVLAGLLGARAGGAAPARDDPRGTGRGAAPAVDGNLDPSFGKYRLYMGLTILCGLGFMVIKGIEYAHKFETHHYPSTNTFLAIYFTLTGLHGLHVMGGMAVNAYFWGPGAKLWKTNPTWFTNRVENAGLFWHFVDLVWIFLFPTLYLL